jgi:hypothetical protein
MNLKEIKENDLNRYHAINKLLFLLSTCKCDACKNELIRMQKEFEVEPQKD